MPLVESILAIYGTAVGTASGYTGLRDFLHGQVEIDEVLTKFVEDGFQLRLPRLAHLCLNGEPTFDKAKFYQLLTSITLEVRTTEELRISLLPLLIESVSLPNVFHADEDVKPVLESIIESAVRGMWRKIGSYEAVAHEVLLSQGETLLIRQERIEADVVQGFSEVDDAISRVDIDIEELRNRIKELAEFAQSIPQQVYDKLTDSSPPAEHKIGQRVYVNPFLLVRAEDFNHNYEKLARLFQKSPEWDAIQSRTENVFIEGGRGTGKSMLLRRLTAQATIAAKRLSEPNATFDDVEVDYFGVYVKLTRGYYEQFKSIDTISSVAASLLAQQELNIEIFDAFIDTIQWLLNNRALPSVSSRLDPLIRELSTLFSTNLNVRNLDELKQAAVRQEQEQIIKFYREKTFGIDVPYGGAAREPVGFLRQLSQIFRTHFFPDRQIRLFLLIDEFETLLEVQQIALNTVMKMRLPDLTMKIAVRKSGRKTADTFTEGDPIQQPRDYTEVRIDYDVTSSGYLKLLEGIAEKRLADAGYPITQIKLFLPEQERTKITPEEFNQELRKIWQSGNRRSEELNAEFRTKYGVTAEYRYLANKGKKKPFVGFSQYALISSGITSNFMELCKYAFFFALYDQVPLHESPTIPSYLQTEAVYRVSQRLLSTIDGNVPVVGSILARLVTDLGVILRSRLLHHPSEPEANRLTVIDFDALSREENNLLSKVIDGAIIWSVLHLETEGEAYRPKNVGRPPSANLIINRIYSPALGISPRTRWAVRISVSDLKGLITPELRNATYQRLMRTIGAEGYSTPQLNLYDKEA
jgi:hypothetical protein